MVVLVMVLVACWVGVGGVEGVVGRNLDGV